MLSHLVDSHSNILLQLLQDGDDVQGGEPDTVKVSPKRSFSEALSEEISFINLVFILTPPPPRQE